MMGTANLSIPFVAAPVSAATDTVWVNIEQDIPDEYDQAATYADLVQMMAYAKSGDSARKYRKAGCTATFYEDTVSFDLIVYVWPSRLNLAYQAKVSLGTVSRGESVAIEREGNVVFGLTDSVELPCVMDLASIGWESGCYNESSEKIATPAVTHDGAYITLDQSCFGVLRIAGNALGFKHTVTITVEKTEADSISGLAPVFSLTYVDADGEEQTEELELEIPQCIIDYLETCPDGLIMSGSADVTTPGEPRAVIYYSTCTGNVLAVKYE